MHIRDLCNAFKNICEDLACRIDDLETEEELRLALAEIKKNREEK